MDIKVSELISTRLNELTGKVNRQEDANFDYTLKKVSKEGLSERLNVLIEDITKQGEIITKHTDVRDMKKYRKLIGEFMNEIVNNSHEFSRENFLDRRGRHRVYGIVKNVDKNLDELAKELMEKEKDNLKILEKVGEINGLLLDVMI